VVVSGQLKLSIASRDGGNKVLGIVRREDSFGEAQALLDQPSPVSVEAVRDSHLLIVDKSMMLQELRRNAPLSLSALASLSQGLMNMIRDAEMCHLRSSVDRVLCYLRHHAENVGHGDWVHEFPALKQDIAASLSITPETFSRVLRGLEREGVIHVDGARVRILDKSRFGDWSPA
jgi:CRP-like cAMP-binding protein